MASVSIQMLGSALALLGWVGVILTCLMPMWRVTAFVGSSIVTAQITWEGIWMTCAARSTGLLQCKPYESLLALGSDLKAAQVLTVFAILTGAVGLGLAFVGGKCTHFLDDWPATKAKTVIAAGAVFIITGFLCILPVSWSAAVVARNFYNPEVADSRKRELGAAIYIGWGASILLFLGGGLLCCSTRNIKEDDKSTSVKYLIVRSSTAGSAVSGSQKSRMASTQPLQYGLEPVRSSRSSTAAGSYSVGRPTSIGSGQSKSPSTKSQLSKRPASAVESHYSEGASTKSQLKKAESNRSETASQLSETASATATKTYI